MPKTIAPVLALALLAFAACGEAPGGQQANATPPEATAAEARRAAEEQLRARLRILGGMHLRAVQVHRQQIPDSLAVCGQVNPTGAAGDPFVPWVAVVALRDGKAVRSELVLGASNVEASRVYIEMVDRCFDGGGPKAAQMQAARPLPPLPSDAPLAAQQAAPVRVATAARTPGMTSPDPAPAPAATGRLVTTTAAHPVNIRSQPGGGGAVVRIVPRASALRVFGEAPGGWLEVGEDRPFGWVHGSMLGR